MPFDFIRTDRKSVALDGRGDVEELGGLGEQENLVKIFCMTFFFNKRTWLLNDGVLLNPCDPRTREAEMEESLYGGFLFGKNLFGNL